MGDGIVADCRGEAHGTLEHPFQAGQVGID
jgi:hypothetical protein